MEVAEKKNNTGYRKYVLNMVKPLNTYMMVRQSEYLSMNSRLKVMSQAHVLRVLTDPVT